jgi:hypothetical protein
VASYGLSRNTVAQAALQHKLDAASMEVSVQLEVAESTGAHFLLAVVSWHGESMQPARATLQRALLMQVDLVPVPRGAPGKRQAHRHC